MKCAYKEGELGWYRSSVEIVVKCSIISLLLLDVLSSEGKNWKLNDVIEDVVLSCSIRLAVSSCREWCGGCAT